MASKISENTIPIVVIIAKIEHTIKLNVIAFSTACLALKLRLIFLKDAKHRNKLTIIIALKT